MIRVAAAADLHVGTDSAGTYRPLLEGIEREADLFLLAGDLTRVGDPDEAQVLADELRGLPVPIIAVLGNHDYHLDRPEHVAAAIAGAGVQVLEGAATTIDVDGHRVGVAGTKGFGGGFAGACGSEFGEPEMKVFMAHTRMMAERFEASLSSLEADLRIGLLHYSPIPETLEGEPREIYPWLGSYLFAEAADRAGADLLLHGHAHAGSERGTTPGGIPVRNVALAVIGAPYRVLGLGESAEHPDPVTAATRSIPR